MVFLLAACDTGSQRRINREALLEEIRNREPKKLSEAEIVAEAHRQGREIADKAQQELLQTLKKAIQEGSIPHAVQYCKLEALPLTDSLSEQYGVEISRTSLRLRNGANAPDELEKQLLEAYQYNAEEGLPLEPNVQEVGREYLLYTQPIMIGNELCLSCHGELPEVSAETTEKLNKLYPNDQAHGYELGSFRGMWSIKFPIKEIVKDL